MDQQQFPCAEHAKLNDHMAEVNENVAVVKNNIIWLVAIGKWAVGLLGALLMLTVPLLVTFGVYISKIDRRLSNLESKFNNHLGVKEIVKE